MEKNNSYGARRNVLRELSDGFFSIHDNFKYFSKLSKEGYKVLGASEWLLDNIYLIEKEYKAIKREMPIEYFEGLTSIDSKENVPRIFLVAKDYINNENEIDCDKFINHINMLQEKDPENAFTMGELWAFPLMLKTAIIISLAEYINALAAIQKETIKGKNTAEKVVDIINNNPLYYKNAQETNSDTLKESGVKDNVNILYQELRSIQIDFDHVSPLFLREFFRVLRDNSIEDERLDEFMETNWNLNLDYEKNKIKSQLKEEVLENHIGEYITYIRKIEGISWRRVFENTSLVEKKMKKDPQKVYDNMDFQSKDYYRHKLERLARKLKTNEVDLANNILELAQKSSDNNEEDYKCHVGYYLIDDGVKELRECNNRAKFSFTENMYLALNIFGTLIISFLIILMTSILGIAYTRTQLIISFLIILIPVNEIIIGLTNWTVNKISEIRLVPKLNFSNGIPEESKTVVVIPAITNSTEKIKELMKKLEVAYCGNKDKNLYFALLCDFLDSQNEVEESDTQIIKCGIDCARKLNEKYAHTLNINYTHTQNANYTHTKNTNYTPDRFFFLSRSRLYNDKQKVYMGKERKRGKLMEFMALIRGSKEHTFNVFSSDIKELKEVKYLITLDEDTFMPRESAKKLVGAMSHVLNFPNVRDNRVVRGYGVMQPKVSIGLEAKNQSYFSKIFGGEEGVDGYSTAYSDTYQDLFGEGSFTGKGIINIDKFYEVLHNAIKDNKILSHDLLEGGIARCALVSDVEFVDGYPGSYESSCKRLHRWVRGDWQLIGWLFSNKLTLLYKWKIFDNLRRSLLAPNILLALILSLTVLSSGNQIAALCFFALISSLVFTVTDFVVTPKNKLMGTFKNFEQVVLIVSFIPYQSYLMVHAIFVTLFRVIFSKKNLLQWQSAEFVEKNSSNDFLYCLKRMWISPVMGMVILYLSFFNSFGIIAYNLAVAILWMISPYFAYCISMETSKNKNILNNEEKSYLRKIARRIYAYYEDFVNEENNYLAPDNYQEKPFRGVAHRTSPTNIGMGLVSNVAAYDLGYINMWQFIDRTELTLNSMKELERVNGHFLNWYDTKSRKPLWPRYVSTVDSGNLLSDLWVLKQAIKELEYNPVIRVKETAALNDVYKILEEESPSTKIKFFSQHNIGEYLTILKEALYKLQEFKEEQKLNVLQKLSEEKNKLSSLKEDSRILYEADDLKKNRKLLYELSNEINDLEPADVKLKDTHDSNKDKAKNQNKANKNKSEIENKEKLYNFKLGNEELNYWLDKIIDEIKGKIKYYNNAFEGLEKLFSKEFFEGVPNLAELIHRCEDHRSRSGDNFKENLGQKIAMLKSYEDKINKIIKDIDNMTEEMDFNFLYDNTRELFSIGYNVEENSLGNSYYDLLASESRIASFVAIAKNDVPTAHYFKLSRAMTNAFHTHSLVSWSGTMFEYFMPSLIMRNYPKTLFSQTYRAVIKAQMSYAKQKKIPWGISEAAFYEFDTAENYQYKAFGVPGLGLKRGLEDELVVSPYSTLMAVPFAKNTAINNLKRLEKEGAKGRYGFIESIDYTEARKGKYIVRINENINNDMLFEKNYTQNVDKNLKSVDNYVKEVDSGRDKYIEDINNHPVESVDNVDNFTEEYDRRVDNYDEDKLKIINNPQKIHKVVNYMVHHLGMSLMALDNILQDNILIDRFHTLPEVKATELLLKEKIPQHIVFERNDDFTIKNRYFEGEIMVPRNYKEVKQDNPQVLLLSNGEYSTMITASGSGYSKKNDTMLYRWKGNSTSDDSGMFFYIKNLNSNDYWSSTFEPCKASGDKYEAEFNLDKAKFIRKDGNIETEMEVVISTDENFEVRKLTLNNLSDKGRSLEITSYMEITLAAFGADAAHPAFSNLFIQTEYEEKENILIGSRRGRVKGAKVPYIFHKIISESELEGPITYETSRINFIGRNRELKSPIAMDNDKSLTNTVGTVLDPIMSMRARIRLEPNSKKEIYFVIGIGDSKEQAIEICRQNNDFGKLSKVFKNYSISVQLELKNLGIRSGKANSFQSAASEIFFLTSNRKNREEYIINMKKHQKDLWAYGISGDLPIIMAVIENEKDTNLVLDMIKFHYYLKLKGVKLDLVIYNNEEISYEAPLQKNILEAIRMSGEGNFLNKPGGIFVHNKATMDVEVKNLLIGISRIYVDSKNILKSYIYVEKNMKPYMELKEEGLNSQIALRNNSNVPYAEYDHDEDLITGEDLLKGMKVADDLVKVRKENQNIEKSQSVKDTKSEIDDIEDIEDSKEVKESLKDINESKKTLNDFNMEDLDFFNGYGGFSKNDKSYIIKLSDYKNTPAPWINVISNEDFGFHISETGAGYTWCGNSRENKITPWSNDYIRDPAGEALYIKDNISGKYFSISPKPVRDSGDYFIKHSFGYSEFIHKANDLNGKLEVFAPKGEKLKIQRITLENLNEEERSVSVFCYAKLVLGVYEYDSSRYISTYISDTYQNMNESISKINKGQSNINERLSNASEMESAKHINARKSNHGSSFIGGKNPYSQYFGKLDAYLTILGGDNLSFTGDNKEFIGIGGELSKAEALDKESLSNNAGGIYDPCLAAQTTIKLKKGEKKQLVILFGQEERDKIENIIHKYKKIDNVEAELDKVKQYWSHFLGNIQVKTPDKSLDYLLNGWLLYQTLSCRYLSRSAFYQSGGAYGFRDQLQDSMALGVVNPEIPKAQILRSASRQYVEGDVQHWWHPVVNSGIRTRFSDDLLWLPYVTAEYINSTGDYEILEKTAPYLEDEPLREGEDERYTIVNQSSKEGTIYEHCLKAIEKSLKFGAHNIPLMGSGDWNDGMSTVGNEGKGESVWLGWFLYSILNSFIEIAEARKDEEIKKHYEERKEFIRENLENNAWDGGWYRRAYFDDGTPLGSRENPECQIDSLAQSWSIISGAFENSISEKQPNILYKTEAQIQGNPRIRAIEAMEAVDRNLVKKDKGMILLLAPPFDNSYLEPGYIKGYVPGVRENGGQYTHAAVWVILALTKLGLGDKAVQYFNMINPINHSRTELECMNYKVEPYVMAADVYIKEPHAGRGGWSWYTGASGWMYRVGIENILGLRKVKDKGYTINPCVPKEWSEFEIRITNEKEDYNIKVSQSAKLNESSKMEGDKETKVKEIKVYINGKEIQDKIIPRNAGKLDVEVIIVTP